MLWLDSRHWAPTFEELLRGPIDEGSVHPRTVVKTALAHNAAACIVDQDVPRHKTGATTARGRRAEPVRPADH
ncbi:MAG: JAB domain-containing protein, partial [Chromatiaceae bacterium]